MASPTSGGRGIRSSLRCWRSTWPEPRPHCPDQRWPRPPPPRSAAP